MIKQNCSGCRDNFYNNNNPLGVKNCWSFDVNKKLITKYRIHRDTPMSRKNGYTKIKIPPCYCMDGYGFVNEIPNYAI